MVLLGPLGLQKGHFGPKLVCIFSPANVDHICKYLHVAPNLELAKDLEYSLQDAIALEVFGLEGRWVLQGVAT